MNCPLCGYPAWLQCRACGWSDNRTIEEIDKETEEKYGFDPRGGK